MTKVDLCGVPITIGTLQECFDNIIKNDNYANSKEGIELAQKQIMDLVKYELRVCRKNNLELYLEIIKILGLTEERAKDLMGGE